MNIPAVTTDSAHLVLIRACIGMLLLTLALSGCGSQQPTAYTDAQIVATPATIQAPGTQQALSGSGETNPPLKATQGSVSYPVETERDAAMRWKEENWPEYLGEEALAAAKTQWAAWEREWEATYGEVEWCSWVIANSNLRAGPGTDYPVIGKASTGACVHIWGMNKDATWFRLKDEKSWIFYQLVQNVPLELMEVDVPSINSALSTPTPTSLNCSGGCTTYPDWCVPPIKGNIGFNSGERIYHVPGGEYYASTTIDPSYGERWFCTEAEAQAAGWRRSSN